MKNNGNFQKFLVASNLILLAFIVFILSNGFRSGDEHAHFTEIDAERINIIGESGRPVLVISNKKRIPGPSMNGKNYSPEVIDGRKYFAGMIFFNELGDEVGGLIYAGLKKDSTSYSQVLHLSFDQWKQNQVIGLDYNDNSKSRFAGLRVWDRPVNTAMSKQLDLLQALVDNKTDKKKTDSLRKLLAGAQNQGDNGVERMFIGSRDQVAQIQLKDKNGKVKAKLYIDNNTNDARLAFYNEKGEVVNSFPK